MDDASPHVAPLAITLGDPNGIGPEIVVRWLAERGRASVPAVAVVGSARVFDRAVARFGPLVEATIIDTTPRDVDISLLTPGVVQRDAGRLAAVAIERAIAGCLSGEFSGMVTAPIHKEAIRLAGIPYPGHTEWIGARCGVPDPVMMLYDARITVVLATCHIPLAQVPSRLTTERVIEAAICAHRALGALRGRTPRLALLGLNPHAGENGLLGSEERTLLDPAMRQVRAEGLAIEGPIPPDTAFTPAALERYDAYICLYHDQGLIPFKALAFSSGVNVSLGLPIVRTSVDHGTAFDIAWKGTADMRSLGAAIDLASVLAVNRGC